MLQINGLIKTWHNGVAVTFDDLEVELLDRVEHSSFYKCNGFDEDGNKYVGTIEKCCGEYESIEDIERVMKTSVEVEAEFRAKMQALISEYKAEVSIEDVQTYAYTPNNVISVYIPTIWVGDEIISDSASFNFGSSF